MSDPTPRLLARRRNNPHHPTPSNKPGRSARKGLGGSSVSPACVPVSGLSIFDPVFLGIGEDAAPVTLGLPGHNMLVAGEPGAGKSVFLQNLLAHAALCTDVQLWLFDGKRLELSPWAPVADEFVGPDLTHALAGLAWLQAEIEHRTKVMEGARVRKLIREHGVPMILVVIDEVAYYSATAGDKNTREEFAMRLRDVVARGRAVGIIVIAATQRPSADIIPTSLRDIFGYRVAFRCTTPASSDIILGVGWHAQGYTATDITPEDRGVGWLLAEGGIPRRFRSAFLSDNDITWLVTRATHIRGQHPRPSRDGGAA